MCKLLVHSESNPLSIYHTGPIWLLPTGPQAQRILKEAWGPVGGSQASLIWLTKRGLEAKEVVLGHNNFFGLPWANASEVLPDIKFGNCGGGRE